MGKRTAAEADVGVDDCGAPVMPPETSRVCDMSPASVRPSLLTSPVPFAWPLIPERSVEPRGACHTRVRTAARTKDAKASAPTPNTLQDNDADDDLHGDHMTELSMALPPLVAPRPRRAVSPDLIFEYHPNGSSHSSSEHDVLIHARSLRRRAFRPIGADRPDVEITSPPARAMNPVVLDARFKNMQRLDLELDARDAPLQPFHRPCAQRRVLPTNVNTHVSAVARVAPLTGEPVATKSA